MIRIIKEGTRQQMTCSACGCLFSYEQEDIQSITVDYKFFPDDDSVKIKNLKKFYVKCPQCHQEVITQKERYFQ